MDSTPHSSTQHPPNPSLQGIHNTAIIFITSTVTRRTCSLQPPCTNTWEHIKTSWQAADIHILHQCNLPYPVRLFTADEGLVNVIGSCTCIMVYFYAACRCTRVPFLLLNMSAVLYWRFVFPSLLRSNKAHLVGNSLQSIPLWYFVGGFPQMRVFLWNGREKKTWTPSLWPESRQTQKNTNKINLCQLQPGARMKVQNGTVPKQGGEKVEKNIKKKEKKKKTQTK